MEREQIIRITKEQYYYLLPVRPYSKSLKRGLCQVNESYFFWYYPSEYDPADFLAMLEYFN
jgi:hypothetical protein